MNELATRPDSETLAFYEMLRELRLSKRHVDSDSNKGYVKSAKLESSGSMIKNLSLRIIVWSESISESTTFTCDSEFYQPFCSLSSKLAILMSLFVLQFLHLWIW